MSNKLKGKSKTQLKPQQNELQKTLIPLQKANGTEKKVVYWDIPFIKSDIKVTIGMLVSNNIKYIEKCMESIKPILDNCKAELIVVDTVGPEKSDGSLEVVKRYTDKIYHFDWINDFSAARNVALDHARGEWFMYLDDDEYFDDVTEFIEFFNSDLCEHYNFGLYYTGDYTRPNFYRKSICGRMIKRTANTRFEGVIHEGFTDPHTPLYQFNAFTHHFGYLYTTEEQRDAKTRRNMILLEKELQEKGPNPRVCAQLVQEYMVADPVEGSKRCLEYVRILDEKNELGNSLGQWLLTTNIRFLCNWDSVEGVLDLQRKIFEKYKVTEVTRLVIAQQTADVAFRNNKHELALENMDKYFEMYDWLMSHDQERMFQIQLDNTQFLQEECVFAMAKAAVVSAMKLRRMDKAREYYDRLCFEFSENPREDRKVIENFLKESGDADLIKKWLGRFYNPEFLENPELNKYLPEKLRRLIK